MPVTATTLDAVNTMLLTIGEAPVSSTEDSQNPDVSMALHTLNEVLREVLSEKWRFNSDEEYPLAPATNKEITLPSQMLTCDVAYPEQYSNDVTIRGRRLYNRKTSSYKFDKTLKVEARWFMEFDDLPPAAAHYVTIRSARKFADRVMASRVVHEFSGQDEDIARVRLVQFDTDEDDANVFNQGVGQVMMRNRRHA